MKSKILSMLDTTKKKAGVALLCGSLVAAIGTGTVFAAGSTNSLMGKMENGVGSYSTDGGKTWSKNAADGVLLTEDKDGKVTISNGTPPKDGEGKGILCKVENGVGSYSTDGGKTWSKNTPDGLTVSNDGKTSIMRENPSDNENPPEGVDTKGLMVKVENGVSLYSTDSGKTWSKNAPDGVTVSQDGKITMMNGIPPKNGDGKGTLSKVENGVSSYSTDGGKTWSEKAPDGAEDSVTIGS